MKKYLLIIKLIEMYDLISDQDYKGKIGGIVPISIGRGSYGKVYESNNNFAVKIQKTSDVVYIREISILRYLDHINIIKPEGYMFVKKEDEIHFAMKKADTDLECMINSGLNMDMITSIAYQLLKSVEYLESKSIIHRDIKPSNILIYGNTVKLCDFGLAKYFVSGDKSYVFHTGNVQTIWYRAPEVAKRCEYGFKADIWSIGAIILEMVGNDMYDKQRNEFMYDCIKKKNFDSSFKENPEETEFVLKWFSYLVGGEGCEEIEWINDKEKKFIGMKSKLHKLCDCIENQLVDLALKLLKWLPEKRLSAFEALTHPCFKDLNKVELPNEIEVSVINWYDSKTFKLKYLKSFHRTKIFDWLWEVCRKYYLAPQLCVISFALFDSFILFRDVSLDNAQLVAVSCLSIVDKMVYVRNIEYYDWKSVTNDSFSCRNIIDMEQIILNDFNFNIVPIFDSVFKYRCSKSKWVIISCMLTFDDPKSIDYILQMDVNEIISKIKKCGDDLSKLKKKSLKILKVDSK